MRPLVLNAESQAAAAKVMAYAAAHVVTWAEVQAMATGALPAVGVDEEFNCIIPIGYRCAFSYEMQRAVKFRHLSVSVDRPGRAPNEHAMHEIAKLFGFEDGIKGKNIAKIWVEQGDHPAINVLEACE